MTSLTPPSIQHQRTEIDEVTRSESRQDFRLTLQFAEAETLDEFSYIFFCKRTWKSEIANMFGLFRTNPVKKLEKKYAVKLTAARDLQRKGDIIGFARVSAEADSLLQEIEAAESADKKSANA